MAVSNQPDSTHKGHLEWLAADCTAPWLCVSHKGTWLSNNSALVLWKPKQHLGCLTTAPWFSESLNRIWVVWQQHPGFLTANSIWAFWQPKQQQCCLTTAYTAPRVVWQQPIQHPGLSENSLYSTQGYLTTACTAPRVVWQKPVVLKAGWGDLWYMECEWKQQSKKNCSLKRGVGWSLVQTTRNVNKNNRVKKLCSLKKGAGWSLVHGMQTKMTRVKNLWPLKRGDFLWW